LFCPSCKPPVTGSRNKYTKDSIPNANSNRINEGYLLKDVFIQIKANSKNMLELAVNEKIVLGVKPG